MRRLALLQRRIEAVKRKNALLLAERNAVLAELDACGVSRTQLAQASGLTAGRITQLLNRHSADLP
jgi:ParB-like chromosome segregation protein Spo0J